MPEEENKVTGESKSCNIAAHRKTANDAGESKSSATSSSSSSATSSPAANNQWRSCKGCLYYSSTMKSDSRNPLCLGLTRSLPPDLGSFQSEMEASKEGRSLSDFRYACVGYSLYLDQKARSTDAQEGQTELPLCVGLEALVDKSLVDKRHTSADTAPPVHAHNREDGRGVPQPQPQPQPRSPKPTHSTGDEFLTRFTRSANLVAMGVVKNLRKVGNRIKESVDDIFYRRPK